MLFQSFAKVSDLKFCSEDKTEAFVKFKLQQQVAVPEFERVLANFGRSGQVGEAPSTDIKFFALKKRN